MKSSTKFLLFAVPLSLLSVAGLEWDRSGREEASRKPLDTIVGVPNTPTYGTSKPDNTLSFVLNLSDGREILCSYNNFNDESKLSKLAAAIMDAYLDSQSVYVSGRLDENRMNFLEVIHPDFGEFKFLQSRYLNHPDFYKNR